MGIVCEARGSVPGIENSGAQEIHGRLWVSFPEVYGFLWGVILKLQEGDCDMLGRGRGLKPAREARKAGETPVWPGLGGSVASGKVHQTEVGCGIRSGDWLLITLPSEPFVRRRCQDGFWGTQNQAEVKESRGGS